MSLVSLAITVIIIGAVAAIVVVAIRTMGLSIPPWVITIGWICLVAFVAILAIRFLASM